MEENNIGVLQTLFLCVHILCKVNYDSDKFIYTPMYSTITRSCGYINLQILKSMNNISSVVFNCMVDN